jgi:hypothetical protein
MENPVTTYKVVVQDNFHWWDETERYEFGTFTTWDEAVDACKNKIEQELEKFFEPGMDANQLYDHYIQMADEPFILASAADAYGDFSESEYAMRHCEKLTVTKFIGPPELRRSDD